MSQYGWANCLPDIQAQIDTLLAYLTTMLSGNLVGIYLHGSLAMGCFNPERSDIDLLAVIFHGMPVEIKRDIVGLLLRSSLAPCPIEISFLVEQEMHPFRHPMPFDLHYSEAWRERYTQALENGTWRTWNDEKRHDNDLAAHLTITRARGICLYGKPAREVFPTVPPEYYADAIIGDFDDALREREHMPVYFVLNACRVLAFLRGGDILSKDEGGSWGLQALPEEQHSIVAWALEVYRGEHASTAFDNATMEQFARYTERDIGREKLQGDRKGLHPTSTPPPPLP